MPRVECLVEVLGWSLGYPFEMIGGQCAYQTIRTTSKGPGAIKPNVDQGGYRT